MSDAAGNHPSWSALVEHDEVPTRAADMAATIAQHPTNRANGTTRANGQPRVLVCKYDAGHGAWINPKALGDHYAAVHPEYKRSASNARQVTCRCGRTFLKVSARYHMANMHPEVGAGEWAAWLTPVAEPEPEPERVPCPACEQTFKSRDSMHKHRRRVHADNPQPSRPRGRPRKTAVPAVIDHEPEHNGTDAPFDAAYIMQSVIGVLAHPGGMVPVEHLEPIYVWREATATMLRAIASGA